MKSIKDPRLFKGNWINWMMKFIKNQFHSNIFGDPQFTILKKIPNLKSGVRVALKTK